MCIASVEHSTVASIHINTRVPYLAYYIMFPRGRGGKSVKKGGREGGGVGTDH